MAELSIKINLDNDFVDTFNWLIETFGQELAELNGFGEKQLNYTGFIDNFVDKSNVADASIDGNANVGSKDIVTLENEMSKPHSKLLAFNKIFYEIKKARGVDAAKDWIFNEFVGVYYMHDSHSSSFLPYCWAADLTPIAEKGLFFVNNFNAEAPKHLTTFTDFSVEFVSYQSNRSSGAVGLPNFLVWSYYFWKHDVANGYYLVSPEYYRDQEFQRVIYKLNQPYVRSGIQSAFTNFNVFDHPYAEALFGSMEYPDGSLFIDDVDGFIEYQKAFMEVVSKIRSDNMMTFPVLSYSLLYKDGDFVDEEFARWCSDHNMLWADSNFYVSDTVDSLSSCCRLSNNIEDLLYFNSIGGTALEVGSVKVSTVNLARIAYSYNLDEFEKAVHDYVYGDLIALDTQRHIIQRNIEKGLLPNYDFGLVNIDNQYSTVGVIGIYEAIQHFGGITHDEFGYTYYTEEGLQLAESVFKAIHQAIDDFKKDNDIQYKINVEQIPKMSGD